VAVAVLVENAGHGSEVAAPIVRNFLVEYFRDLKPPVATPPRPPVRAVQKPATPDPAVPSAMARLDSLLKAGLRP
jgi:hypothetical protein